MKNMLKLFTLFALLSIQCSPAKVTTLWKAPMIQPEKYKRILVLGIFRKEDSVIRKQMESHIVGDLINLGYAATSSLEQYGPKAFENMNEAQTLKMLTDSLIDAVLTIILLNKQRERVYVDPNHYNTPDGAYYYQFHGYRIKLNQRIYAPGYFVTATRYFWESNFYEMSDQKLVYSAHTESFDTEDTGIMSHVYSQMIVRNMLKRRLLEHREASRLKPF